jgi:hypothetical protein
MLQIICTITLDRPTARVGQKSILVGHGLPSLIARAAPDNGTSVDRTRQHRPFDGPPHALFCLGSRMRDGNLAPRRTDLHSNHSNLTSVADNRRLVHRKVAPLSTGMVHTASLSCMKASPNDIGWRVATGEIRQWLCSSGKIGEIGVVKQYNFDNSLQFDFRAWSL